MYHVVQNVPGPKLQWLGHYVSICGKPFVFASKQCPQVPQHFEICRKTFMVQAKTMKTMKVLALQCFVLYGSCFSLIFHWKNIAISLYFYDINVFL